MPRHRVCVDGWTDIIPRVGLPLRRIPSFKTLFAGATGATRKSGWNLRGTLGLKIVRKTTLSTHCKNEKRQAAANPHHDRVDLRGYVPSLGTMLITRKCRSAETLGGFIIDLERRATEVTERSAPN